MTGFLAALVTFSERRAWLVIAVTLLVTLGCGWFGATHLDFNSDTSQLIAPGAEWQRQSSAFDTAFPQTAGLTVIVVDGASADAVADGTAALADALRQRPDLFRTVRQPDGGEFFDRYGLLFLDAKELSKVADQVTEAQPLLGPVMADPSLRGLFGVLGQALQGLEGGEASGDKLQRPIGYFAKAARSLADGHPTPVDWGELMTGAPPRPDQLRRFIEVQAKLDFDSLEPGAKASAEIRRVAGDLHLPEQGVRVRLTGDVPIEDDEFASVTTGGETATELSAVLVLVILLIGLRAPRLIAAIAVTLIVGLVVTVAFAAATVVKLNMISIAFAVLFIGLSVDFGIQFSMRYRAELFDAFTTSPGLAPRKANRAAIARTAPAVAGPLAVAALATAVGFYSFLPTSYRGVSELGEIAGSSMLIALIANLTVLPAMLSLLPQRGQPHETGFAFMAPVDRWIDRRAWLIAAVAVLAGVCALGLLPWVRFDADPLDMKDPSKESLKTALELARDPMASPYTIDVLAPDLAASPALADHLAMLPEVKQTLWLGSFVPDDQDEKLDILGQMAAVMGPAFEFIQARPAPSIAEEHEALGQFIGALTEFEASPQAGQLGSAGSALLDSLRAVASGPDGGDVASLRDMLLRGLAGRLRTLREAMQAKKLTLDSFPASFKSEWVSADGRSRIQLFPTGDMKNAAQLARFVAAVRAAAPNATGAPVAIYESGKTVSDAFVFASSTALAMITLTLAVVLRRVRDVVLVVVPLVLAGLYTLGTCVVSGLAFNYANVIAIPLLMGIGVAFDIYFVMAWRDGSGPVNLLRTPIARAVAFSAVTTGAAFGTLALSHHAGNASMGVLLVMALGFVVFSTLIVQPALMTLVGRGPRRPAAKPEPRIS